MFQAVHQESGNALVQIDKLENDFFEPSPVGDILGEFMFLCWVSFVDLSDKSLCSWEKCCPADLQC